MLRPARRALLFAAALMFGAVLPARAARGVLVLYKASEGETSEANLARSHAHASLERLGYAVDYREAAQPLLGESDMRRYSAVLTWFKGPRLAQARDYPSWLARQVAAGRKVVVLGNFGAFTPDEKYWLPNNYLNEFFYPFGLDFRGDWTDRGALLEVAGKSAVMSERELPFHLSEINHYYRFVSRFAENKVHLSVRRTDLPGSESAVVVRTPFGGFALESYLYKALPGGRLAWRLDLAAFLKDCLGAPGAPDLLPQKRVLGLYKAAEGATAWDNEIRRFLWRPLYDLGYWVDFRDAEAEALPGRDEARAYHAVVTWFRSAAMTEAAAYCRWLGGWLADGRRVVVLGNFGAYQERLPGTSPPVSRWLGSQEYNDFFYPFGLVFEGRWTKDPELLEVVSKSSSVVESEIALKPGDVRHYFQFRGVNPANRPFLEVRRKDLAGSESQLVVATPYGGFALESYLLSQDTATWAMHWRLDRGAFLQASLEGPAPPAPRPLPRPVVPDDRLTFGSRRAAAPATPLAPGGEEVLRTYLALYKSADEADADRNPLFDWAEAPLNWLGVKLRYHDVSKGLPSDDEMAGYAGVLSWFDGPKMTDARGYWDWLGRQAEAGRKVVILGDPGGGTEATTGLPADGMKAFFRRLGLDARTDREAEAETRRRLSSSWLVPAGQSRPGLSLIEADGRMFGFEKPLDPRELHQAVKVLSTSPRNRVHLRLLSPLLGEFHPVVTGPWGGVALGDAAVHVPTPREVGASRAARKGKFQEQEGLPNAWRIDPFRFFETALGLRNRPRLDPTTLNGSRIAYAHIDGDGFAGVSLVDKASFSGQMVRDRILRRYNLPTTVSFVAKDIETRGGVYFNPALTLARSILELPNTEGATHTYSHPFNWRSGDAKPLAREGLAVEIRPTDLPKEVLYSTNYLDELVMRPNGKRTEILLWSGDCRPDPRALEVLERAGLRNMNGGDPVFDARHPTYSSLRPLARQVGPFVQVHTSARGDFLYTDGWTRNFGAFADVTDHFARTESPRRVAPLNIYYHFYSGDREEGLAALSAAYEYALSRPVAPLFASEYADIVMDFRDARIFRSGANGWRVLNSGALRTLRFDAPAAPHVDLERSRGVIGYRWHQGSLYASLDESSDHEVFLSTRAPRVPFVEQASHRVEGWQAGSDSASLVMRGVGKAFLVLRGLSAGADYEVEVRRLGGEGEVLFRGKRRAGGGGGLRVESEFRAYGASYGVVVRKAS